MIVDDGRRGEAKRIPIMEVAHRLGISGLTCAGLEHVGACPVCGDGGKRFPDRFAINPTRGIFLCRKCDVGGDGIELVQFVKSCDFLTALDFLVGAANVEISEAERARRKEKQEAEERQRKEYEAQARAKAIRDAREIWHAAFPALGTAAEAYLAGRGISFPHGWPPTLRFLPNHPYLKHWPGRGTVTWHRGPCMIAAVQDAAGRVTAVHQTWVDTSLPGKKAVIVAPDGTPAPSGKPYPAKLVRGSKKGGAIRLTPLGTSGVMIMGEGIETTASAIAAGVTPAAAFWSGVDLGNMAGRMVRVQGERWSGRPDLTDAEAFVPPAGIKRLVLIQDGDSDPKATRAKLLSCLRRARSARPALLGRIVRANDGQDLNDMRMETFEHEQSGPDPTGICRGRGN